MWFWHLLATSRILEGGSKISNLPCLEAFAQGFQEATGTIIAVCRAFTILTQRIPQQFKNWMLSCRIRKIQMALA